MQVTNVTIDIHEKKNHPHEFGHFDARCSMSAQIGESEDGDDVADDLRTLCRAHVQSEIDRWLEDVQADRDAAVAESQIGSVARGWNMEHHYDQANDYIGRLPDRWQQRADGLRQALELAWQSGKQREEAERQRREGEQRWPDDEDGDIRDKEIPL